MNNSKGERNGTNGTNGKTNGHPGNYGFEEFGFNFPVSFFDLQAPELFVEKTHYNGFKPSVQVLPKGHTKEPGLLPIPCDMIYARDQSVKMRDGTTLYTDVFRPVGDEKIPAILPYSPYGKSGTGDMS